MDIAYKVIGFEDIDVQWRNRQAFARMVLQGMSATPKVLSSAYFYDDRGSELFEAITELEEYYLTGAEYEILQRNADAFVSWVGETPFNLVELGSGDGRKTSVLLKKFLTEQLNFSYVPVDISAGAMRSLEQRLRGDFDDSRLRVRGLVAEYFEGPEWLNIHHPQLNIVLFMGSNIGNFNPQQAHAFLHPPWFSLNNGDLVVTGFDLKKDIATIERAYNDSRGLTREFNLNLLDRINEELGADFDRDTFMHRGHFNPETGAMESWLISTIDQQVFVAELEREFELAAWEGIRTEYSHKYHITDVNRMARHNGFEVLEHLVDSRGYFVDSVWKVVKKS